MKNKIVTNLSMLEFKTLASVARTPKYLEEICVETGFAASSTYQAAYRLIEKGFMLSKGEREGIVPQRFRKQFIATFTGKQLVLKTLKEIKESTE